MKSVFIVSFSLEVEGFARILHVLIGIGAEYNSAKNG
jgi:hypothetical protein